MKRKIHKMAGIFLSVCIAAGSITLPRVVSSAAGDTQTELSDKEDTQVQERKENSFRYKDGQPIDMPALYADEYEYAWEKVDGYYRNNVGAIIEGATRKGIDVSHHQQQIDWEKVKADGIDFAILRCGYGGDYEDYDDDWWEYNVSECERLGIPYGVYLYSYSVNTADAVSEAEHTLRLLEGHQPTYPVYYDLEDDTTASVDNATIGQIAKTYCDMISEAGYEVGIYANYNWWTTRLTDPVFDNSGWSKWVARYNPTCGYEKPYDMWQCTNEGSVDGINGNVDLNFWMTDPIDQIQNRVSVSAHVQTYGWMPDVTDGKQAGVIGKRMEALKIRLLNQEYEGDIQYRTHVQTYGWLDWAKNGELAGTEGESKRVEAVELKLTGQLAENFDLYYRAYVQGYGWLGWAKNGESSGSSGYSRQMEAIQVKMVPKNSEAPGSINNAYLDKNALASVAYQPHVQTYGWVSEVSDGAIGGVTGESKRMEALKIRLARQEYDGDIEYKAHVQTYGWLDWAKNGELAGTEGESKRVEAIQIRLTGDMAANYDVYYRTHVQTYGWLDWAKNGESAGTTGMSKRIEAVQVVLVKKGLPAPGSTKEPCLEQQ
ncbi:MAG: GH25 family lysozyme [Sellimonas sp.]|uniref:GH25 family lysozyme n=1 Tax=Sellimonas sp. TaxID=2021466 RepID=UPI0039A2F686